MSIAIFSALQDTRRGVAKIQTTLEGLPTNLETVCRTSTREAIHEAIHELKVEAYQAVGGAEGRDRGFRNGEAEKIISQLVDQLAEQERLKEEEDLLRDYTPLIPRSHSEPTVPYSSIAGPSSQAIPYAPASASSSRRSSRLPPPSNLSNDNPFEPTSGGDPFEPSPSAPSSPPVSLRPSSLASRRTLPSTIATSDFERAGSETDSATDSRSRRSSSKKDRLPAGSIIFLPKDPFTNQDLIDPVLANGPFSFLSSALIECARDAEKEFMTTDGLIHDRWSLVNGSHQNVKDPKEPLIILGDVVQLREAIFQSYPERRLEFTKKRQVYREVSRALTASVRFHHQHLMLSSDDCRKRFDFTIPLPTRIFLHSSIDSHTSSSTSLRQSRPESGEELLDTVCEIYRTRWAISMRLLTCRRERG